MILYFCILLSIVRAKKICRGNDYTNGSWMINTEYKYKSKSFYCCENDDIGVVDYCGDKKVEMTTFFFRNDELTIPSNRACVCDIMENTRHNESLRETFKWVPDSCMLESFDGKDFCNVLGKKRLLLVGDSLMHQLASTLYNTLKTLNAPCLDQISFGKTTHLKYTNFLTGTKIDKNQNLRLFFNMNVGADICLLNSGAHLDDGGDMFDIWESIKPWINEYRAAYNTSFAWVTQSYGHLHCENFKAPLEEFSPIPPEEYRSDKYTWRRFPHFDEMSKDLAKINNLALLDISMLRLRPDAHKAKAGGGDDCLHWCLPGPLDIFPTILYNKLSVGEI